MRRPIHPWTKRHRRFDAPEAPAFIVPPVEPCVVVGPASIFMQTAEMHESPGSHAPPEVHAQPSAPNAQLVAVVEEHAVHKKESAAAAKIATQIRLPLIVSSLAK